MGLLRPGETCWRLARAPRVKFLVDCQDYFRALDAAFAAARRSIHLLGWGFDPRIRLLPDEPGGGAASAQIGHALVALTEANPALDVRLLVWRSALPISASQAFFPHRAKGWFRHSQVDFQLDAAVPAGACHHQKVVVIDDALAFVGGADLMADRWDTSQHLDADPRRRDPSGRIPPGRHEVMAMVDGPAAAAFGELFRNRWRRALGELPGASAPGSDPWPPGLEPDLVDADIGVARTVPAWRHEAVREIATLTLAAILQAKSLIYLENQYFTWPLAVEALAARLAEPDGPEVVLVITEHSPSYFDRLTMDQARSTALWRLRSSDVFGRFHVLAPFTAGGRPIVAHAKTMIVDDVLARISSANLNNRSHGFDTECELALEAKNDAERAAIGALRDRLAGHWVGRAGAEVAELRAAGTGLADALWALDGGARLRPLKPSRLGPIGEFIADFHLGDPTDVSNSWRIGRRRETLLAETRAMRALAATREG